MPKKCLVTGVCGLIGSHLADALLAKGYHVVGIDNLSVGSIENIKHNLADPRFKFAKLDCVYQHRQIENICSSIDILVHLASTKKIYETNSSRKILQKNVNATENMLELARQLKCQFVFASSSDVYGHGKVPMSEEQDLNMGVSNVKRWSYAMSKLYGEFLCFSFERDFDIPVVVLRYFGTFGERASPSWSGGHPMVFIKSILNNEKVIIHGDGSQTRTLCYVTDIIEGTIKAIETPEATGEIINLGGTEEISVLDFALLIGKVLNHNPKLKFIPFKHVFGNYKEIMRRVPDLTKAKKILGYDTTVSMIEAIQRTVNGLSK